MSKPIARAYVRFFRFHGPWMKNHWHPH